MNRQNIIDAWEALQHTLSDNERGRATLDEVKSAYTEYVVACLSVKEPAFHLPDIMNDDMAHIPVDYPHSGPVEMDQHGGTYDTPTYKAYRKARRELVRKLIDGKSESEA